MSIDIANKLYHNVIKRLDAVQREAFDEGVNGLKPLIAEIESKPAVLYKDHYGDYLGLAKDIAAVTMLICAGANHNGVIAAARINGVNV